MWSTACRSPIFEFPSGKGITRVQTSQNVDISRHSNGHIFRYCVKLQSHGWVRWYYTYCVCWCDLDRIQGQGQPIGAFELPTISEAVHAGGDDRSHLAGLSGFKLNFQVPIRFSVGVTLAAEQLLSQVQQPIRQHRTLTSMLNWPALTFSIHLPWRQLAHAQHGHWVDTRDRQAHHRHYRGNHGNNIPLQTFVHCSSTRKCGLLP